MKGIAFWGVVIFAFYKMDPARFKQFTDTGVAEIATACQQLNEDDLTINAEKPPADFRNQELQHPVLKNDSELAAQQYDRPADDEARFRFFRDRLLQEAVEARTTISQHMERSQ